MSAEYAILWPALVEGGPALLVVKVLSRSPVCFVREHWRRFDARGMFVETEHDPTIALGAAVRFCVIGLGALRLLEGAGVVTVIRRAAGGRPGLRVQFTTLDAASRTLHQAMVQHAQHVEHIGVESLPVIPPPLPRGARDPAPAVGEIYRVRQRPALACRVADPKPGAGPLPPGAQATRQRLEFDQVETSSSIMPLDDDTLRRG